MKSDKSIWPLVISIIAFSIAILDLPILVKSIALVLLIVGFGVVLAVKIAERKKEKKSFVLELIIIGGLAAALIIFFIF